jgi:2-deoxy-D-gluconate 3-dehydrogenase
MTNPFDLTGQLAVVTGASRGIGRGIAVALSRAGADIVGVSTSIPLGDSDVRRDVESAGRQFQAIRADLGDREQVYALAAKLSDLGRPVDTLVNNAGTIRRNPALQHTYQDWDDVLGIDLSSQFILSREVGKGMVSAGRGRVIFTASMLSFQGGINVVGYAAAKTGLVGVMKTLANEWAPAGVNVNAIAPGYIATDNTEALRNDPDRSRSISERIPAGRWGTPADLGGAAVFLASAAADYVTGIVLPVDGGWLAR